MEGSDRRWAGQLRHGDIRSTLIAHEGTSRPVWWLGVPLTPSDILNLNHRTHWAVEARLKKQWRDTVHLMCRSAKIPPCGHILVALHYAPAMSRRRDPDNLVASLKPACDGIVDAGVIPDDTSEFVTRDMPVIEAPIKLPDGYTRLALYIERIR